VATVDHLGRAEELRRRAVKCRSAAERTTSPLFKVCYDLLATNYAIQADLEEHHAAATTRIASAARRTDR
jgi:hypothetical protein